MSAARTRAATLLVDIGNTRVKWARLAGGKLGRQHAAAYAGWGKEEFAQALFGNNRFCRYGMGTIRCVPCWPTYPI